MEKREIMIKAHKMTKLMVERYNVNYRVQLGLCLKYYIFESKKKQILETIKPIENEVYYRKSLNGVNMLNVYRVKLLNLAKNLVTKEDDINTINLKLRIIRLYEEIIITFKTKNKKYENLDVEYYTNQIIEKMGHNSIRDI